MNYKICVPIPIKFSNVDGLKPLIDKALRSSPNLIEFRFDYINDIQFITPDFIYKLKRMVQSKIPTIFTFRDHKEGGKIKIDKKKRLELLKTLILTQPDYLDIEIKTEKNILTEIIDLAYQNNVKIIFSYHDFDKTPSLEVVSHQIEIFINRLCEEFRLDSQKVEQVIFKMIFTAKFFEDNLIPLRLCEVMSKKKVQVVSFCMGNLGIFSRVLCVLTGSFFTYGSIVEETAPGQINIENLRKTLNLLKGND